MSEWDEEYYSLDRPDLCKELGARMRVTAIGGSNTGFQACAMQPL